MKLSVPLVVEYREEDTVKVVILRDFDEVERFMERCSETQIITTFELGEAVDAPQLRSCLTLMKQAIDMLEQGREDAEIEQT